MRPRPETLWGVNHPMDQVCSQVENAMVCHPTGPLWALELLEEVMDALLVVCRDTEPSFLRRTSWALS